MKNLLVLLFAIAILCSCSKVKLKRLEGTWKVKEIKETPSGTLNFWSNLLDSSEVKVAFYVDGTFRIYYFQNNVLTDYSEGTYLLSEDDETLVVTGSSIVFNSQGYPLDVTSLQRSSMTLEGRYYLHYLDPSVPDDSFVTLKWSFQK